MKHFFDDYPAFYETSKTLGLPRRLNWRVKALIKDHVRLIKNKSILDIASHDGRFSFAAIKFGASHVLGIEGRPELVENAKKNMEKYGIMKSKYDFIAGDIHKEIQKIKPNTIQTVFCFGFFYHTIHHAYLLSQIRRLNPQNLILDTNVIKSDLPIIKIKVQNKDCEGSAIHSPYSKKNNELVGIPSKKAIQIMLRNLKFSFTDYDWHNNKIINWQGIGDYKTGHRITLIAKQI